MYRLHIKMIFILLVFSLFTGTSSAGENRPAWVSGEIDPHYPPSRFITGVGIANVTGDETKDRKRAEDEARSEIAKSLKIRIVAFGTTTVKEEQGRVETSTRSAAGFISEMTLSGIEIRDRWYDEKRRAYYALAILNKGQTAGAVREKLEERIGECKKNVESAEIYEQSGEYVKALNLYAAILDKPVDPDQSRELLNALGGSIEGLSLPLTFTDIENRVSGLIASLKVEKVGGDEQTIGPGRPPRDPLTVRVTCRGKGQGGVPISFESLRGTIPPKRSLTDHEGIASYQVGEMHGVRLDVYKVAARLKMAEIVGPSKRFRSEDAREAVFTLPWRNETLDEHLDELAAKLLGAETLRRYIEQKISLKIAVGALQEEAEPSLLDERERGRIMAILRDKLSQQSKIESLRILDDERATAMADAIVEGSSFSHAGAITLSMKIRRKLGDILASVSLDIPIEMIKGGRPPLPGERTSPVPLKAEGASLSLPAGTDRESTLSVSIRAEKERYQADDPVVVYVTVSSDCYVVLIYGDPDGRGLQIFPNDFRSDRFIRGGTEYQIPDDQSPFEFRIRPPLGRGTFYAFASIKKIEVPITRQAFGGRIVESPMEVMNTLEQKAKEQGIDSTTATCTIITGD